MKTFRRLLDLLLLCMLGVMGVLVFKQGNLDFYYLFRVLMLDVFYYSLVGVSFIFLIVFALGSYMYLIRGLHRNMIKIKALAAPEYLYVGMLVLLGCFRGIVETGSPLYHDVLWLSFLLLWAALGGWFLLVRFLAGSQLQAVRSTLCGLLIALNFPLVLTAFSYHLQPRPEGLKTRSFYLVAAAFVFLGSLYVRLYLGFVNRCSR